MFNEQSTPSCYGFAVNVGASRWSKRAKSRLRRAAVLMRHPIKLLAFPMFAGGTSLVGTGNGAWRIRVESLPESPCVLSAGVGTDASFEAGLLAIRPSARILSLDPTPPAVAFAASSAFPTEVQFVQVGLWDHRSVLEFFEPGEVGAASYSAVNLDGTSRSLKLKVQSLAEVVDEYLDGQWPDVLKMDIEGAEFRVIPTLKSAPALPPHLLFEIDQPRSIAETTALLRFVDSLGYRIVGRNRWEFSAELRSQSTF